MKELEKEFSKIKLKPDTHDKDKITPNDEKNLEPKTEKEIEGDNEKLSNRQIRQLLMKSKKEQKRKKQNTKNVDTNKNIQIDEDMLNEDTNDGSHDNADKDKNIKDIQNDKNTDNIPVESCVEKNENEDSEYKPQVVEYCKVCGVPYEYCEYGDSFSKCKEENKDKYNYDITDTNGDAKSNKRQTKKTPPQVTQKIKIQKTSRAKKKVVTVVTGLHAYVKLDKMAKIFSRFYACGASVIKGSNGSPDQIDIQGDVEHNLIEVIMKHCPELTEDRFVILPPK